MIPPAWSVFLGYQIAWFACVAGGARGLSWPGWACAAAVSVLALAASASRARTIAFIVLAAAAGAGMDAILAQSGWISFPHPAARLGSLPLWMIALWLAFTPCIPLLARWLAPRPLLAAGCGLAGGPLAFWGATRFEAVAVAAPEGWIAVALEWGALTPLLCALAARAGLTARARGQASA